MAPTPTAATIINQLNGTGKATRSWKLENKHCKSQHGDIIYCNCPKSGNKVAHCLKQEEDIAVHKTGK